MMSAGTYDVIVGTKVMPSRGMWQLAIGGKLDGFAQSVKAVADPQDEYGAGEAYTEVNAGIVDAGDHER